MKRNLKKKHLEGSSENISEGQEEQKPEDVTDSSCDTKSPEYQDRPIDIGSSKEIRPTEKEATVCNDGAQLYQSGSFREAQETMKTVSTLEKFSAFGNVKDEDSPPDPVPALVLLFYKPPADPQSKHQINVLMLPKNVVIDKVLHFRRKLYGDEIFLDIFPHCKLRPNQVYSLSASFGGKSVLVQPKEAEFDAESSDSYFSKFQVVYEEIMKLISLSLRDSSSNIVWERRVCLSAAGIIRSWGLTRQNLSPQETLKEKRIRTTAGVSGPAQQIHQKKPMKTESECEKTREKKRRLGEVLRQIKQKRLLETICSRRERKKNTSSDLGGPSSRQSKPIGGSPELDVFPYCPLSATGNDKITETNEGTSRESDTDSAVTSINREGGSSSYSRGEVRRRSRIFSLPLLSFTPSMLYPPVFSFPNLSFTGHDTLFPGPSSSETFNQGRFHSLTEEHEADVEEDLGQSISNTQLTNVSPPSLTYRYTVDTSSPRLDFYPPPQDESLSLYVRQTSGVFNIPSLNPVSQNVSTERPSPLPDMLQPYLQYSRSDTAGNYQDKIMESVGHVRDFVPHRSASTDLLQTPVSGLRRRGCSNSSPSLLSDASSTQYPLDLSTRRTEPLFDLRMETLSKELKQTENPAADEDQLERPEDLQHVPFSNMSTPAPVLTTDSSEKETSSCSVDLNVSPSSDPTQSDSVPNRSASTDLLQTSGSSLRRKDLSDLSYSLNYSLTKHNPLSHISLLPSAFNSPYVFSGCLTDNFTPVYQAPSLSPYFPNGSSLTRFYPPSQPKKARGGQTKEQERMSELSIRRRNCLEYQPDSIIEMEERHREHQNKSLYQKVQSFSTNVPVLNISALHGVALASFNSKGDASSTQYPLDLSTRRTEPLFGLRMETLSKELKQTENPAADEDQLERPEDLQHVPFSIIMSLHASLLQPLTTDSSEKETSSCSVDLNVSLSSDPTQSDSVPNRSASTDLPQTSGSNLRRRGRSNSSPSLLCSPIHQDPPLDVSILPRAASLPTLKLQSSFEEFSPGFCGDPDDETFWFRCSGPGWYQCRVSGLMFDMTGGGDVFYRVVPWDSRLLSPHGKKPAGPLFDISCQQRTVARLHLPHCEVRSTGPCHFLSVAHLHDGGVEFIRPETITETHIVISITGFSAFGNVKDEDSPPDPVRALVLLFYRPPADPESEHEINVLMLPKNVVLRTVLHFRKLLDDSEIFLERPPDCKLQPNQFYSLSASPEEDSVLVEPEEAEFDAEFSDNYLSKFCVSFEKMMKYISLSLRDSSSNIFWKTRVCLSAAGVRRSCGPTRQNLSPKDQLKEISVNLTDRISEPVLKGLVDKLLMENILNASEREAVNGEKTREDKARVLVQMVGNKGDDASSKMIRFLCELDPYFSKDLGLM